MASRASRLNPGPLGAEGTDDQMIFVAVEGGTLEVVEELAASRYEPIDVESGVFRFYAADGTYLEPRFTQPNRHSLFVVEPGAFSLVRSASTNEDSFELVLSEVASIEPNPWFTTLEQIREFIAKNKQDDTGLSKPVA
jgi:hypothetical protein